MINEKITKLVKELEEKNKELQTEISSLSKNNLSLLDNSKKEFEWDKDLLKEWHEEYWHTYSNQSGENEWFIAVPKFIPFSLGWLDHTTKGYNVFKINQYTQWLGEMPEFLRKELNIKEPEKIFVSDGNLVFTEGKEDEVKERYGDLLSSVSKGTARVRLGKEFDLIAKIIENGSLPFVPKQVDEGDLIPNQTNISFEGKYIFQKHAWDNFLKYGAIGIYWMTGAGKDIFSCYALSRIKVKEGDQILPNLYVSPNLTILEQMRKEYFPKYAPELLKDIEDGKLILSTYQGYDKIKGMKFGLTIFGESHVLPADSFSRLATIKTKYRIGQSASPFREDGRSLGYDEPILLKVDGKIGMYKIGKFIDKNLNKRENKSNIKDVKVLTNINEKVEWRNASQISRHNQKNNILKLKISSGRDITVSDDHSIMILDNNFRIIPRECKSIQRGDIVLLPSKISHKENPTPYSLARILGWYLAEGSMTHHKKGYCVSFSLNKTEQNYAEQIVLDLLNYGIKSSIYKPKNRNEIKVVASNKKAYLFLKEFGFEFTNSHTKRVPPQVFDFVNECIEEFLKAYQLGDAGVTVNQELASDIAYLYSFIGKFATIHRSLNSSVCNFPDGHIIDKPCQRYIVKPSTSINQSPFDYLPINFMEKSFEKILTKRRKEIAIRNVRSFSHKTFVKILGNEAYRRLKILKIIHLQEKITTTDLSKTLFLKKRTAEAILRSFSKKELIYRISKGHKYLGDAIWKLTNSGKDIINCYSRMQLIFDGDFKFGKVISKERISYKHKYVYDFAVPNTQTFIAGSGGVLCHNTNYIFALTGFPIGLNWQDLMKLLGKKYHDINVYIFDTLEQKIRFATNLIAKDTKTLLFVDKIAVGERLANILGVPFVHGATKNRIQIAKESKVFIASRVMELGISIKDLEHVIEVDFLFGSKREEIQRTGRLFHSESKEAKKHDILMTKEEFESYGKRLHGLVEKGFKINLRPMITGSFQIKKPETIKGKSTSARTGKDYNQIVNDLVDEGFFSVPVTAEEVRKRVSKKGIVVSSRISANINNKLNSLVKSKRIAKFKQSGKSVYQER